MTDVSLMSVDFWIAPTTKFRAFYDFHQNFNFNRLSKKQIKNYSFLPSSTIYLAYNFQAFLIGQNGLIHTKNYGKKNLDDFKCLQI